MWVVKHWNRLLRFHHGRFPETQLDVVLSSLPQLTLL